MARVLSPPNLLCWRLLLLLGFLAAMIKGQDCDLKCATSNCNSDGACICELPSNSSMLQGDRSFLGGQFCDTPQTMCDGSNSFWCENGICNEIIQGENYTCICKEGYTGEHCELGGVPCGDVYCYHNGQCNEGDGSCECPASWKGSVDCSTPTTKSSKDASPVAPVKTDVEDNDSWYIPVVVVIIVLVVAVVVVCGVKSIRKRSMAATEFHKLRQVQMRGFVDEDEDAFAHAPLSKAELA
ncbi:hypothetical protein L7F22_013614 [Adiantum nelumboides]|nr:hypothetical protein [Adiantum nelumboides]